MNSRVSCNLKVHYPVPNNLPLVSILSQVIPFQAFHPFSFRSKLILFSINNQIFGPIQISVYYKTATSLHNGMATLLLWVFPTKSLQEVLFFLICSTCSVHLILLHLIPLTNSARSKNNKVPHSAIFSILFFIRSGPSIFFGILLSKTLIL
jgi:hypothetical protein